MTYIPPHKPNMDELPSTAKLLKSTRNSAIVAIAILVTIVLPAEYGVDPTGIGNLLGLKEMGEVKVALLNEEKESKEKEEKLKAELEQNTGTELALVEQKDPELVETENTVEGQVRGEKITEDSVKKESIDVTIPPNGSAEIKLVMGKNDTVTYTWKTNGGGLNYNMHGESKGNTQSYEYSKGTSENNDEGEFTAVFDGTHGWFFRNREKNNVTVNISVEGGFASLIEV